MARAPLPEFPTARLSRKLPKWINCLPDVESWPFWSFRDGLIFPFGWSRFHISLIQLVGKVHQAWHATRCYQFLLHLTQEVDEIWFHFRFNFRFLWDFRVSINSLTRPRGGQPIAKNGCWQFVECLRFLIHWPFKFGFKTGSSICFPVELSDSMSGALLTSFANYPRSVSVYQSGKVSF